MLGEVLTVEEAARFLKVTRNTVRRWCSSGRLAAFKIGRAWRIPTESLEIFIARAETARNGHPELWIAGRHGKRESRTEIEGDLWSRMVDGYEQRSGKEAARGKKE